MEYIKGISLIVLWIVWWVSAGWLFLLILHGRFAEAGLWLVVVIVSGLLVSHLDK